MNTAIDVNQLSVTLGGRHILHDINVSVPVGKITTLIGPNVVVKVHSYGL